MKHIIGASVVAVLMVGVAVAPASALTIEDIQSQIRDLLSRVATLTAQMNQLKSQGTPAPTTPATPTGVVTSAGYPHRVCALLNRNLSQGMSGDDVRSVQEFLQGEGFLAASPTGYFGPMTAQAIAKWQAREGIAQAGSVGPLSRERIKRWCGGGSGGGWNASERFTVYPTHGDAPLEVYFETWLSGFRPNTTYYSIDFGDGTGERAADCLAPADACISPGQNRHTYIKNGTYTAVLNKVIDPCAHSPLTCKAAVQTVPVAKQTITVGPIACTKEYRPVCGSKQIYCVTTPCNPIQQTYSNECMMRADGASYVHEGQCRTDANPADNPQCKSWYDGCNTCSRETPTSPAMCTLRACFQQEKAYCTSYFDASTNKPPTISGFSGPTTLTVNQTGTWSVQASDPENGQLSYSIRWGDEVNVYPLAAMSTERAFTQTTTFTHAYANAGTYAVVITVRDNAGQEARTSTTVRVGNEGVVCTMEYAPICGKPALCLYAKFNTSGPDWATHECNIGKTYSNRCALNAAGAELIHDGACTSWRGIY